MQSIKGQLTLRGFVIGCVGCVVITAASVYTALKMGALPWPIVFAAIVSLFLLKALGHGKASLNEANVTHTVMSAGAMVAGGLAFTIPGIWMLGMADEASVAEMLLVALSGVALGLVCTAVLRKHFIEDTQLEYPIGEAAAQTLIAGEAGGKTGWKLFGSLGVAGIYTALRDGLGVLPALEEAVPGAAKAIYRFSRLAAEDEEYFERQVKPLLSRREPYGDYIAHCEEKVVFRRAALKIIAGRHQKKDYTSEQLERLYALQFAENGKKFEFLNLTAFKEEGRICIVDDSLLQYENEGAPYEDYYRQLADNYCGQIVTVCFDYELDDYMKDVVQHCYPEITFKVLRYDGKKIPKNAIVRFMRAGDKFTKFGGGTKKLGDFFTDRKLPVRLRKTIPLLCDGNDVLIIFGVEISDKVKLDEGTQEVCCAIAADYGRI